MGNRKLSDLAVMTVDERRAVLGLPQLAEVIERCMEWGVREQVHPGQLVVLDQNGSIRPVRSNQEQTHGVVIGENPDGTVQVRLNQPLTKIGIRIAHPADSTDPEEVERLGQAVRKLEQRDG